MGKKRKQEVVVEKENDPKPLPNSRSSDEPAPKKVIVWVMLFFINKLNISFPPRVSRAILGRC